MNLNFVGVVALCGLAGWLSTGCVDTVDGRRTMGVPWVKDTVEGRYERTSTEIFTAAKDVLKHHGVLLSEDIHRGSLEGNVDTRRIWIHVEDIDTKLAHALVQARRQSGSSDIEMAGFIDKQIAVRLATGNLTPTTPTRRVTP